MQREISLMCMTERISVRLKELLTFSRPVLFFLLFIFGSMEARTAVPIIGDAENANWEIFTARKTINSVFPSESYLWIGTEGGLEKREVTNDKLLRLYTTLDGLNSNEITHLIGDCQSGVWVGTPAGISHILASGELVDLRSTVAMKSSTFMAPDCRGGLWLSEGKGFKHLKGDGTEENFNRTNSDLPSDVVNGLASDGTGGLFIGTNAGVAWWQENGTWQIFNKFNTPLPKNNIKALINDGAGGFWIVLADQIGHRKANGQWQFFDNANLPNGQFLYADQKGITWIRGLDGTMYQSVNGQWQTFLMGETSGLSDNRVWALYPEETGKVLVWTGDGRLSRLEEHWETVQKLQQPSFYNSTRYVNQVVRDEGGRIWFRSKRRGMGYLDPDGTWEVFFKDNSDLPSSVIESLELDGNGGVWVGTESYGLAHLHADGTWKVFTKKNSDLPSGVIKSLESDGNGGVWVGTQSYGLAHLPADGTWEVFTRDNSDLPDNSIESLELDGNGGVWVETRDYGLAHFHVDGTWEVFTEDNSDLPDNSIVSLELDGNGGVWVGTWGYGLAHLHVDGTWEVFTKDNSDLPDNLIVSLELDGNGGVWVGTYNNGLAHLHADGTWEVFTKDNSDLPDSRNIRYLELDGNGGIWVASYGFLAHLHADGTWEVFTKDNSGIDDIYSLESDGNGGVLVGGFGGQILGHGGVAHFHADDTFAFKFGGYDSLWSFQVNFLLPDGAKGYWLGTTKEFGHLTVGGHGRFDNYNADGSEVMLQDDSGGFYVGRNLDSWGEGGLNYFTPKGEKRWVELLGSQYPKTKVTALLYQNGLWVGTSNQGLLYQATDGSWNQFTTENSKLPINHIHSLFSDGSGGIKVWTATGQLAHLKSTWTWEIFHLISKKDIHSVMPDEAGGFWVGTNKGLEHVKADMSVEDFSAGLPNQDVRSLAPDGRGGLYAGTLGGLAHLSFGNQSALIEQIESADTPDTEETLLMLKGQRAAIIIAGGGSHRSNTLWDTTEFITNYIYKVLNKRGFVNEEIYYLSPKYWADFNGDGLNDQIVDAPQPEHPLTVEDVREALQWAKTRGPLDQPLYVFLIDHGGTEKFQLSQLTNMGALKFNDILDDYQNTTGNQIVLIIDACHSGSLLKQLMGKSRAVISSTDHRLAYFDRLEKQGFSRFLANGLLRGMSFFEAFEYASQEQTDLLGQCH